MATIIPLHAAPLSDVHEAERRAFNRAFRELGLPWYWEVADYRELCDVGDALARVRRYVEHRHAALLTAYDAEFIARLVSDIVARVRDEYPQGVGAIQAEAARGWTPGSHSVDYVA